MNTSEKIILFIIVDRKKADLFILKDGEVDSSKKIMNPGVGKESRIDSGEIYGKNTKLSHKIDNQIHRHLQLVMHEVAEFINGKKIDGVFIGGHKPMFSLIEKELPAELRDKLRGDFVTELNITDDELIKHCKVVLS